MTYIELSVSRSFLGRVPLRPVPAVYESGSISDGEKGAGGEEEVNVRLFPSPLRLDDRRTLDAFVREPEDSEAAFVVISKNSTTRSKPGTTSFLEKQSHRSRPSRLRKIKSRDNAPAFLLRVVKNKETNPTIPLNC